MSRCHSSSYCLPSYRRFSRRLLRRPFVATDSNSSFLKVGKTLNEGGFVCSSIPTGASLLVQRITRPANFSDYALHQAERIMMPLGSRSSRDPRALKDSHDEWVQYEIRGNRLTDHRRILYRAFRRDTGFFELIYEAREDDFDLLMTEAQSMASSIQAMIETPPVRTVRRARR